jgi:hypothetical protein
MNYALLSAGRKIGIRCTDWRENFNKYKVKGLAMVRCIVINKPDRLVCEIDLVTYLYKRFAQGHPIKKINILKTETIYITDGF